MSKAARDVVKSRSRNASRTVEHSLASGQARRNNLPESLFALPAAPTIESQAARLSAPQLRAPQRQLLAARLGRIHGNRHLQRVIACRNSAGQNGVVQRDLADVAASAAQGLLDRLTGRADSEKDALHADAGTKSEDIANNADSKGAELQSDSSGQSSQLTAEAGTQGTQLSAQGDAQSVQVREQGASTASGVLSQWTSAQADATATSTTTGNEAETRANQLEGEGERAAGDVKGRWSMQEDQTSSEVSILEKAARALYSQAQGRAQTLLAKSDSSNEERAGAAHSIEAGWDVLVGGLDKLESLLTRAWDGFSQWAGGLWNQLGQNAGQALSWVRNTLNTVWQGIQRKWGEISSMAGAAWDKVKETAANLWNGLKEKADSAWNALKQKASQASSRLKDAAVRGWNYVKSIGEGLVSSLRAKGEAAVAAVRSMGGPIMEFFASLVNRALASLSSVAGSVADALSSRVGSAWNRVKDLGSQAWSALESAGTRAWSTVRDVGAAAWNRLKAAGAQASNLVGAAWQNVKNAWTRLQAQVRSALDSAKRRIESLSRTLRDRIFQPALDWAKSKWNALKKMSLSAAGKLLRGYRRLKSWASSAWSRSKSTDPKVLDGLERETRQKASAPFGSIFYKPLPGGGQAGLNPQLIQKQLGKGHALDGNVKSAMEPVFGQDLSRVRIHTGTRAAALAGHLNARAFTVGNDIAFGDGEYRPGSLAGNLLIAHELAHVVQQRGAVSSTPVKHASSGSQLEQEADRAAVAAVLERKGLPLTSMSGLSLQRCSKPGDGPQLDPFGNVPKISPNDILFNQVMDDPSGFPTYSACLKMTITIFHCREGVCVPVDSFECEIEISFPGRTMRGDRNYPGAVQGIVADVLNRVRKPLSGITSCTALVREMTTAMKGISGKRINQGCRTMIGPNKPPVTPIPPLN
jgi:hypothetical protein